MSCTMSLSFWNEPITFTLNFMSCVKLYTAFYELYSHCRDSFFILDGSVHTLLKSCTLISNLFEAMNIYSFDSNNMF